MKFIKFIKLSIFFPKYWYNTNTFTIILWDFLFFGYLVEGVLYFEYKSFHQLCMLWICDLIFSFF